MANCITRHIPNTLTCLNLFSGCIAGVMAFQADYTGALLFIFISAVFDFFDGMAARLLNAHSIIGKDLDSLADDVSFGVAPSLILFSLFNEMLYPTYLVGLSVYLPYAAFLIAVFSALRLAKFNNDARQSSSFVGLPVPANALFWASLVAGFHSFLTGPDFHPLYLVAAICLFSWLLVAELPMFSLKFKNLLWKDNALRYIFLLLCVLWICLFQIKGIAASVVTYILLSCFTFKKR